MKKQWFQYVCFILVAISLLMVVGCSNRKAKEQELDYRHQGIEKLENGQYEEAVELFQKALDQSMAKVGELEVDICYYKAVAQYKSGNIQGAMDTYTALIEYDKENTDAYYLRGTMYLEQGNIQNALLDYQEAMKKDKKNPVLFNKIGERLINAGYTQEAAGILDQALEIKGDKPKDYREKGYAYYLKGQYDSARTYLDKAINMGDEEAVFYLAKMLEAQGKTEQANQLYESYATEHSSNTELLNELGCTKMEEGNYEKALLFFQTALKNENPSNEQELRRNEIAALEYMLDFTGAKKKMEAYVKDYPEDTEAAREYEFLKSR